MGKEKRKEVTDCSRERVGAGGGGVVVACLVPPMSPSLFPVTLALQPKLYR